MLEAAQELTSLAMQVGRPAPQSRIRKVTVSRSAVRKDRRLGRFLTGTPGDDRDTASPDVLPVPLQ